MSPNDNHASQAATDSYGLSEPREGREIAAPKLNYQPQQPRRWRPAIGVIGCGGISSQHLSAYRAAGYRVVALCDRTEAKARERQQQFFPEASIYTDYRKVLERGDVEVVDITTHPLDRVPIIEDALAARKHTLSQKPFVLDLSVGRRLVELAAKAGVKLAVNQNGRWAPHFSYLKQALDAGLIGELASARFSVHWDHSWIGGTRFEEIRHLVLLDFAIHWFDMVVYLFAARSALRVSATSARAPLQAVRPPMLAQAIIDFDEGQAALAFNGGVEFGQRDCTFLAGSRGALASSGPSLSEQRVTLHTIEGRASPALEGTWFREGFMGAMGELLCSLEEEREPTNNARDNLNSLALCFAAIASAESGGVPQRPGEIERLPGAPSI